MAEPAGAISTSRSRAKADRRTALLKAAAGLFAERGYHSVSTEDLGSAVGVSGPAVYRHFDSKQSVLAALLVGVSEDLFSGGQAVVKRSGGDAAAALRLLIAFHVDFALTKPDVIRVQDRDLANLDDPDRRAVRTLQRSYVELWVDVLTQLHPDVPTSQLRLRAHATFGLINSTPHSTRVHGQDLAASEPAVRETLEQMALAALG